MSQRILLGGALSISLCAMVVFWESIEDELEKLTKTLFGQLQSPEFVVRNGVAELIGNTPMLRIKSLSQITGCEIYGKAELYNPGGSPKDRVSLEILKEAEAQGRIVPGRGDTIYEGTVGSTGISLALLCKAMGYNAHIFMPSDQSMEKVHQLEALGATVERVKPASIVDRDHYVNKARLMAEKHSNDSNLPGNGVFANQFENPANFRAHFQGTGPEIYRDMDGKIDALVAGAGTGGTVSGISLYLKPQLPSLKVVLADPQGSGLSNRVKYGVLFDEREREGTRRRHQVDSIVEGVGLNRATANFEAGAGLIDEAVRITDEQVVNMSRFLIQHEGLFVGSSTCLNLCAAVITASRMPSGSKIVTILCDPGHRHLSKLYNDEFLITRGITPPKNVDSLDFLGIE